MHERRVFSNEFKLDAVLLTLKGDKSVKDSFYTELVQSKRVFRKLLQKE